MIGPGRMLCKGGCPDDGSLQARGQAAKDAVRMGLLWGKPAFKHQGRGWAQTPDGVIFQPIWPRSPHPRTVSLQFQPAFRAGRSELSRPNILFLVWSLEELKMHRLWENKHCASLPLYTGQGSRLQGGLLQAGLGLGVCLSAFLGVSSPASLALTGQWPASLG